MKIWYVLRWGFRALLAELRKLYSMQLTDTFYLTAESCRLWIEVNPETVSLDANNVQKSPLDIRVWSGEGSEKTALAAYLTLKVESVVGNSVTMLYAYNSTEAIKSYSYTIPANSYATANRISVYAYEDAARSKEIGSKQVNIVVENPTPFPRPEAWATTLRFKNGEYLMQDDVIYMWSSRVPGNTTVSPKADLSSATPSGKWKAYQNWPLLATNIALIKFGLIGSAVFKDEYMYSQQGVDANGNPTNDYRGFGTNAFTPNLLLNFLTGFFKGRNMEVDGGVFKNIRSPNDSFRIKENGDIEIVGKVSTSFNGTRIEIDSETNSIKMYNASNKEIGSLKFIESTINGLTDYIPRFRISRYVGDTMYDQVDINSGSLLIQNTLAGNTYSMLINPSYGIEFLKNNVQTKKYPNI